MSDVAIRVENLGKMYRIGAKQERYGRFTETAMSALTAPFGRLSSAVRNPSSILHRPPSADDTIWALRDVSFEVQRGDVVGIIGRNGAGKSTLLKTLSRITEPTEGRVELHGHVGSLLEVGTGFHPELTGRENVYLNGAILGMRREEIQRRFDEIVEFSGVERFLDTPVKRYSSGMQVRLAFAVAAHLEPEILLVDEVLAAGDAEFQKKCLGKMGEVASQGRTVLFVSHNMGTIARLCERGMLLDGGRIACYGQADRAIDAYVSDTLRVQGRVEWDRQAADAPRYPGLLAYRAVRVISPGGRSDGVVFIEDGFAIELEYEILDSLDNAWIGYTMSIMGGDLLLSSGDRDVQSSMQYHRKRGVYRARCQIPGDLLNEGSYSLGLLAHVPGKVLLVDKRDVLGFEALKKTTPAGHGRQPGIIRPQLAWEIEELT